MDLGVTNRPGARFGPRALRDIERIGPYNHVLGCAPVYDLRVADVGDVPFASRFRLEQSLDDIEHFIAKVAAAGVAPLSVGGDHSITYPIRSEEHTSELQSLMRISYAVFCLKKKQTTHTTITITQ